MIFLLGDTHGPTNFLKKISELEKQYRPAENDYVIILGDFGILFALQENLFEKLALQKANEKPYKVLFIDGNHENFPRLLAESRDCNFGGSIARQLTKYKNIIWLQRGCCYHIDNKKILTFGGGTSIDKAYRVQDISWWEEENISDQDIEKYKETIKKYGKDYDYIFTHTAPTSFASRCIIPYFDDRNSDVLEKLLHDGLNFKKWYFGHYHVDKDADTWRCLYDDIVRI